MCRDSLLLIVCVSSGRFCPFDLQCSHQPKPDLSNSFIDTYFTILLKYTVQYFLLYSQSYESITTVQFENVFITTKRNYPLALLPHSPFPLPLGTWFYFQCLWICLVHHFLYMIQYNMWPLVTAFFHLAYMMQNMAHPDFACISTSPFFIYK